MAAVGITSEQLPLLNDNDSEVYYSNCNLPTPDYWLGYAASDLVCVFVVAFDIRTGNIIEWSIPENIDLEGVEFKAIPSGSHNIENDLVYFRKGKLYGLACFHNVKVNSEIERGARMKSVGLLTTSCSNIHFYKQFLQSKIRNIVNGVGNYEELKSFYNEHKGSRCYGHERSIGYSVPPSNQFTKQDIMCYKRFMNDLKEQLFLLWKAVMLRKRILIVTQPPIEVSCQRVYCINALSFHAVPELNDTQPISTLFYINVTDIDTIDCSNAYIACTTDRILDSKPLISDVSVYNDQVQFKDQQLHDVITITAHDRRRYQQISQIFSQQKQSSQRLPDPGFDDFTHFVHFFSQQNTLILGTLKRIASSADKVVTRAHMNEMRLDFQKDKKFLQSIIRIYDFNLTISQESSCCCCSTCCYK